MGGKQTILPPPPPQSPPPVILDGRSGRVGHLTEGDVVHSNMSESVGGERERAALCSCSDGSSCGHVLRERWRERRERELIRNGIPQHMVQGVW